MLEFALPLALSGMKRHEQEVNASFWLNAFGLDKAPNTRLPALSTGEKQRLLLASAVSSAPDVLLIDGALEFIDPVSRRQLMHFLKELCVVRGTAIIFAASSSDGLETTSFDFTLQVSTEGDHAAPTRVSTGQLDCSVANANPYIEVKELVYIWPGGATQLYNGLSFSALRGTVTAVVGPNGCGKSTLGHILAGRILPTEGSVLVGGSNAKDWYKRHQPKVAFSFADPDLTLTKSSVRDEIFSVSGGILSNEEATAILTILDLEAVLHRKPFDLDWHTRRRLGIAKAIIAAKRVVFVDEPATDAAPRERERLIEAFKICTDKGLAVVVATNDAILPSRLRCSSIIRIPMAVSRSTNATETSPSKKNGQDLSEGLEWSELVHSWFRHSAEFSSFWASHVYPDLNKIVEALGNDRRMLLVDLGCGQGFHTTNLAVRLYKRRVISKAIGVDRERQFIETARALFSMREITDFRVLDLSDLSSIESLASTIRAIQLPVLFTSFFSLHDFSTLDGIHLLLRRTIDLGGMFVGAMVSPEYVESQLQGKMQNVRRPAQDVLSDVGASDWLWQASFPISVNEAAQMFVPYYHRRPAPYRSLLYSFWHEVREKIITSETSEPCGGGDLAVNGPCSRLDDVWMFSTDYRPGTPTT